MKQRLRCGADGPGVSRMLKGGAAAVDAPLGKGRVLLFGPEITFRAQAHGTFKFLFNGIYYDGAALASSQALALSRKD